MKPTHRYYRWELLALLCGAFFVNQGDRAIFGVVLNPIKQELHFSDSQLGLIGSLLFLTMAVLMPLAGYVGDVLSKKWIITCAIVFWSVATMATGLASGLVGMLMFRSIATAGGETFYTPAAVPLIAAYHQKTRAFALSVHQASLYLGVMTTGCVGGFIADRWGWRWTFYAFGLAGVALGFVLLVRLKDAPRQPVTKNKPPRIRPAEALGVVLRTPTAILLTVAFTAIVFVNIAYGMWAPEFIREKYNLSLTVAGSCSMSFHNLAALVGILIGGRLADAMVPTWPRFRLVMQAGALFLGAPAMLFMGVAPSLTATCWAMAGYGICRGLFESNLYASLFDVIEPRFRASAVAVMAMIAVLLGSVSSWLLGQFRDLLQGDGLSYGFASLSTVFVVGGLAMAGAAVFTFRRDARPKEIS